jgi:regulation of enolase protein 1 (concanavalin A-like superfamily)
MASQLPFSTFANTSANLLSSTSTAFQLTAEASTDIWLKPVVSKTNKFDAPILYKTVSISSFKRARVTVSANWDTLYDQGGLILVFPQANGTKKWVKTGIEFFMDEVFVGTAAADRGADWSLSQVGIKDNEVTLELQSKDGSLWIYVIDGEKRIPIREVTWALSSSDDLGMWVGIYCCRPSTSEEKLVVDFRGFELEITST